jgi:hypothetical protein
MRRLWVLVFLGTAGCLALVQHQGTWPCSADSDCKDGNVCRALGENDPACVAPDACVYGSDCSGNQQCISGTCGCTNGQSLCSGMCTDVRYDVNNCGQCGFQCPGSGEGCTEGVCQCATTWTLCGNRCVNNQTDPDNCGGCGTQCPQRAGCDTGVCACPMGQTACGNACVDTLTDNGNCGVCGSICAGTCTNGHCL